MTKELESAIANQMNEIDSLKEMLKVLLENGYHEQAQDIQRKIEKLKKQIILAKEI